MAFTYDWTVTNNPADHSRFSEQPGHVRKLRTDIEERLKNMLYGFISGETAEGVKYWDFTAQGSDPSAPAATGIRLYSKTVASAAELYIRHTSAGVMQLTSLGKILLAQLVAASQALGDIWYASSATVMTRLAGNITTTKKFLRQTGDGAASAAPAWDTLVAGDVPQLNASHMPTGVPIQEVNTGLVSAYATATPSALAYNDTAMTSSDGQEVLSQAITCAATTNKIKVNAKAMISFASAGIGRWGLFQDGTLIDSGAFGIPDTNPVQINVCGTYVVGTTSASTLTLRIANNGAAAQHFNGSAAGAHTLGAGKSGSFLGIQEIKAV